MATDIEKAFEQLGETVAEETVTEVNPAGAAEATVVDEEEKKLLAIYKEEVKAKPELESIAGSLSDSIEVVKVLGYTNSGDRIHDVEASKTAGKRKLKEVAKIVGFIVKNVGTVPIPYVTNKCTKRADGKGYDVEQVHATLGVGKQEKIAKKHLIYIGCTPQFGLTFKNAGLKKAPNQKIIGATLEELGDKFYVAFKKVEGKSISVHNPKLKTQIGVENADGSWTVTKDFTDVFGYLENEVEAVAKDKKDGTAKPKYSSKDAQANYIYTTLLAGTLGQK